MKSRPLPLIALFLLLGFQAAGQLDSVLAHMRFEMDFRFRVEQDWDSRTPNGTYRTDRTRLRYRFRTGATYQQNWYSVGFRIRTGDQRKQQDPQLTLGKGLEEFGTLPIGFEKIYFQGKKNNITFWLGKNTFPFEKNNELFWSDNVFPEGVFIEKNVKPSSSIVDEVSLKGGHFILSSNDGSLLDDALLHGLQTSVSLADHRFMLFPSVYLFRNIPNIPDGGHSFFLDYSIFHLGSKLRLLKNKQLAIEVDLYQNLADYSTNSNIGPELKDQKTGYALGVQYGTLKTAKDWMFKMTVTSLQRYAIVDFMAQNDWARWDYSSNDSPDGRLSNLRGTELVAGYAINEKMHFIVKYYYVDQLIPTGLFNETGQRIRFDIDIRI